MPWKYAGKMAVISLPCQVACTVKELINFMKDYDFRNMVIVFQWSLKNLKKKQLSLSSS